MAGQLLGEGTPRNLHLTPATTFFGSSSGSPCLQDKTNPPATGSTTRRGFSIPSNFLPFSKCSSEVTSSRKPSLTAPLPAWGKSSRALRAFTAVWQHGAPTVPDSKRPATDKGRCKPTVEDTNVCGSSLQAHSRPPRPGGPFTGMVASYLLWATCLSHAVMALLPKSA